MSEPDTHRLAPLLTSSSAEARIVALTRVEDLDPASLERLLLDKSPRVREQARWRARRREVDLAAFYRARLRGDSAPRSIAVCLEELAKVGDESDRDAFVAGLQDASARVRSAAVTAVAGHASSDAAVMLLRPLLLDQSPRVAMSAARALARAGVASSVAAGAWMSERVGNRRAAWRLVRAAGGWDRVTADLRAATDVDPDLAGLGRTGIANWVRTSSATTYETPTQEQRAEIADRLSGVGLSEHQQRMLAFCAGIKREARPLHAAPSGIATARIRSGTGDSEVTVPEGWIARALGRLGLR